MIQIFLCQIEKIHNGYQKIAKRIRNDFEMIYEMVGPCPKFRNDLTRFRDNLKRDATI